MQTRLHVVLIVGLAAIVWAAVLWVRGVPLTWDHAAPFAITVTAVTAVLILFEKYLWRWPIFKGWLVRRPLVHGTWRVTLQSNWRNPQTGAAIGPISAVMTIRQTYSRLSLRLFTQESSSFLLAGKIVEQDDGVFQIAGVYQNNPNVHLRGDRSEIHHGALLLEIQGNPPQQLAGEYWTDRGTRGSLKLDNRRSILVSSFQEGAALCDLGA